MSVCSSTLTVTQQALRNNLSTERITRPNVLLSYERARRLSFPDNVRRDVYDRIPQLNLADLQQFHQNTVRGRSQTVLVIGAKDKLDFQALSRYGPVRQLALKDIFGY